MLPRLLPGFLPRFLPRLLPRFLPRFLSRSRSGLLPRLLSGWPSWLLCPAEAIKGADQLTSRIEDGEVDVTVLVALISPRPALSSAALSWAIRSRACLPRTTPDRSELLLPDLPDHVRDFRFVAVAIPRGDDKWLQQIHDCRVYE